MGVDLIFEGMDELIGKFNEMATESDIEKMDRRILERAKSIVQEVMKRNIPVSDDNAKSGRGLKGGGSSRPKHGHARDNVPVSKVKKKSGSLYAEIGWTLQDDSEYFYMKFVNWGTLYQPPRDFTGAAERSAASEIAKVAEEELQSYVTRKIG